MSTLSCVEVAELLDAHADRRLPAPQRAALEAHVASCQSCGHAWDALRVLRGERNAAPPRPHPEVFERAMRAATGRVREVRAVERTGGRFWLGAAVGGALAASLIAGMLAFAPLDFTSSPPGEGLPELTIALNETGDMNVAIESPRSVAAARIHVTVSGAVALAGFEDRRELSWDTSLVSGVNVLSLPVRMQGAEGGAVRVEVSYEGRQQTFAVNVKSGDPTPAADQTV